MCARDRGRCRGRPKFANGRVPQDALMRPWPRAHFDAPVDVIQAPVPDALAIVWKRQRALAQSKAAPCYVR